MLRARTGGTRRIDGARLASRAWVLLLMLATAPGAAAQAPAVGEDAFEPVADVTSRYRFVERYAGPATPAAVAEESGALGWYRVAQRVTFRRSVDRPEGAPDRSETTVRSIYDERAASVLLGGSVTAAVRRYDFLELASVPQPRRGAEPASRDGLTVWFQPRPGQPPRVLSLQPGRSLQSFEYQVARNQPFLPAMAEALPPVPIRVGDTWAVARPGILAMAGELAGRADNLVGQLTAVRREKATGDLIATMTLMTPDRPAGAGGGGGGGGAVLNALIHFRFRAPDPPAAGDAGRGAEGMVEARGGIVEFRMGLAATSAVAGPAGGAQLQRVDNREVVLTRDLSAPPPDVTVPERMPEPTPENSWLTYVDPESRFQFRHPQDMQLTPGSTPDAIELIDPNGGNPDVVLLAPSAGDLDPEAIRKSLADDWQQKGLRSIPGPFGWLPEDEWPDQKVYRIEAAILAPGAGQAARRVTFDAYVVKFRQSSTLFARAYTPRDPPLAFRRQVEDLLRTFRYDAPEPAAPAP